MMQTYTNFVLGCSLIVILTINVFAGQGVIDTGFGPNGVRDTAYPQWLIVLDSVVAGNKVWFVGRKHGDDFFKNRVVFGRMNFDGTFDFTNELRPCLETNTGEQSFGYAIAAQADGKFIIGGQCNTIGGSNFSDPFLARINSDGTLDPSFGTNGVSRFVVATPTCNSDQAFYDVAVAADGTIFASGGGIIPGSQPGCSTSVQGSIIMKISPTGTRLASTFATGNTNVVQGFVPLAIQPDGKVLAGRNTQSGACPFSVNRYNADLSADTTFGTNGLATTVIDPAFSRNGTSGMSVEADGKIVVAGFGGQGSSTRGVVVRYLADGTPDTSFGTAGLAFMTPVGNDGTNFVDITPKEIFRQPDGKYLFGGASGALWGGFRLHANGSVDATYGNVKPGVAAFTLPAAINNPTTSTRLPDGSILQLGTTLDGGQSGVPLVVRAIKIRQNPNRTATRFDFDGDGRTDIAINRTVGANRNWWLKNSSNGAVSVNVFGVPTDRMAPADFTGDGKTDVAIFRPSTGEWYGLRSEDSTFFTFQFGVNGDVPVPADFDGDGKAEAAVYRNSAVGAQSFFYYRGTLNNASGATTATPWGTTGDEPVRGDFDGDGKQDFAVFRPSNAVWYINRSSNGSLQVGNWGIATDKRIDGDFDGDGKTDLAVFRPSNGVWYVLKSSDSTPVYTGFGLSTDQPAAADYDGDGKTDISVFRNGIWYINQTSSSAITYDFFGTTGDTSVPSVFVQ